MREEKKQADEELRNGNKNDDKIKEFEMEARTDSTITDEGKAKNITAIIMGVILDIMACIVFFSFNSKYIDSEVLFGGDFNTYTYHTLRYIAIALRWGISGILIGIATLLQFSKTTTYSGKSTTTIKEK